MKLHRLTVLIVLLLFCTSLKGRDFSAGVFNSPKGFGLSGGIINSDRFDLVEIYADLYGVIGGKCDSPGIKACYTHAQILRQISISDTTYSIYFGPGVSFGYVLDYETGNYDFKGYCGALAAKSGVLMEFGRNFFLNAGIRIEAGIHIRPDEHHRTYELSLYENGIYQTFIPELSIFYKF